MSRLALSAPLLVFVTVMLSGSPAAAQTPEHAPSVGVHVGTLGFGADLNVPLSPWFALRGQLNRGRLSRNVTVDEIRYDGHIQLESYGALLDIYPFGGAFRVSLGAYANRNTVPLASTPGAVTLDGIPFTAEEVGTLRAEGSFRSAAPYVGIGYGNPATGKRIRPSVDLGVMFQGSATVALSSTGTLAADPIFQQAVEFERQRLEQEVKNYRYWPVITVSITVRF